MSAGCATLKLNSTWKKNQIIVDGESNDWIENMFYLESKKILLGVRNDLNYFYLGMLIEEPMLRAQMMRSGFILWFDPDGGKKKNFGIKFPIGLNPEDREVLNPDENLKREGRDLDREQTQDRLREFFERTHSELEILRTKKGTGERMSLEKAKGIDVQVKASSSILVYEIKIPIKKSKDHLYAVNVDLGDSFGLCMEIPKIKSGNMRPQGPPGMGGSTPPGGGMSGGRPGHRGGGFGNISQPKGLNMWLKVKLTSKGSSVSL